MILLSKTADFDLWAEHGLPGLVIGSFFVLIIIFIRVNVKKDDKHCEFIKEILSDEREERKSTADKLGRALDNLTDELRSRKNDPKS